MKKKEMKPKLILKVTQWNIDTDSTFFLIHWRNNTGFIFQLSTLFSHDAQPRYGV